MVDKVIKFFTSLRLTVVLLCFGLLLVFVGTLAQVHEGLYQAQVRYFRSWLIWQPTIGDSKWPVLLPGGYLIGTMLLINLIAAHIQRFKFTKKKIGIFMIHAGLILLLVGQLLTDLLSRESSMRLTEGSGKNYSEDFRANELVFVDSSDPSSDRVVSIPESLLAQKGEIRDPALPITFRVRDYWRNCEVYERAPEGAVPSGANRGMFTDRLVMPLTPSDASRDAILAALVEVSVDHVVMGSYLVTSEDSDSEDFEPQTVEIKGRQWAMMMQYAPILGGNLLEVGAAGGDSPVNFAEAEFKDQAELGREGLPFTLRVKQFWPKCRLYHKPAPNSVVPAVNRGRLASAFVTPTAPVTDSEHRDVPGAVVEAIGPQGSLGTWLLWTAVTARDNFAVDGKPCKLAFQFKRYYEPYHIELTEFRHDKYAGTEIPKNFSSRIRVVNRANNEDREVLIKMNSPLRYAGTTYYQGSFDKRDPHVSILQVVTNPGWLTPYLSCLLVGAGLVVQFMMHLIGFITKTAKR